MKSKLFDKLVMIVLLIVTMFFFAMSCETGDGGTVGTGNETQAPSTNVDIAEEFVDGVALIVTDWTKGSIQSVVVQEVRHKDEILRYLVRGQYHEAEEVEEMVNGKLVKSTKPAYYEWQTVPPNVIQEFYPAPPARKNE